MKQNGAAMPRLSFTPQTSEERVIKYFRDSDDNIAQHVRLNAVQRKLLFDDFCRAMEYYEEQGLPKEEIVKRLNPEKLGGFYARPANSWYPLDNAAKIYPLSMTRGKMSVFRVSAYLTEAVVPELLQMALNFTIKRFPVFATTLKRGFFWHYLDSTKRRFVVRQETNVPCQPIRISMSGSQSFRVLYYENRISVEFFHVLSDGTGAMIFLESIVAEYLRLLGHDIENDGDVWDIQAIPDPSEHENSFMRAEKVSGSDGFTGKMVTQMSGRMAAVRPCQIVSFEMNVPKLKEAAHRAGGTITAYMLALMFLSAKDATEERSGHLQIQVPVNMRKYHPSNTIRNFSLYFGVDFDLEEIHSIEQMVPLITQQMQEKSTQEKMDEMMYTTVKLVRSLRFVPLRIKRPVAQIVYGFLGDSTNTTTLSNLGVAKVPESMKPFVTKMEFLLGPSTVNRVGCSMVSYGDTAVFSVSKNTGDPTFEERIYRLLQEEGIDCTVTGSEYYEG